ncbi:hypothetical protein [Zymobacter sp. IVIA_12111.31 C1]|uniref:hypothetical protein n=1 Tax=Zymobacter sp. IVIA_12111.31 C1 TaxID=3394854 RepID=UPI0039C21EC7
MTIRRFTAVIEFNDQDVANPSIIQQLTSAMSSRAGQKGEFRTIFGGWSDLSEERDLLEARVEELERRHGYL